MNAALLIGTWEMVSFETIFEGGDIYLPYGPNAEGRIIYGSDGFMSAHLWDPDRHREDALAATDPAYFAYCATWGLTGDRIDHHVLAATEPGWTGSRRSRLIRWDGEVLELTAEGVIFAEEHGRGLIRWRRLAARMPPRGS